MFVYCSYNVNKMFTMLVDFMTENDKKSSPIRTGFNLTKKEIFKQSKGQRQMVLLYQGISLNLLQLILLPELLFLLYDYFHLYELLFLMHLYRRYLVLL